MLMTLLCVFSGVQAMEPHKQFKHAADGRPFYRTGSTSRHNKLITMEESEFIGAEARSIKEIALMFWPGLNYASSDVDFGTFPFLEQDVSGQDPRPHLQEHAHLRNKRLAPYVRMDDKLPAGVWSSLGIMLSRNNIHIHGADRPHFATLVVRNVGGRLTLLYNDGQGLHRLTEAVCKLQMHFVCTLDIDSALLDEMGLMSMSIELGEDDLEKCFAKHSKSEGALNAVWAMTAGLCGLVQQLARSAVLSAPIGECQVPMLAAQNILIDSCRNGVAAWDDGRSMLATLFETSIRVPSSDPANAVLYATTNLQCGATLLATWLSLLGGSLKQKDWGSQLAIGYAGDNVLARSLLVNRDGESLPPGALKPVLQALLVADSCVHNYLLGVPIGGRCLQKEENGLLDIAADTILEWASAWVRGVDFEGTHGQDPEELAVGALCKVEMSDAAFGHALRHGHIRPLLGMMGFVEKKPGELQAKPIASYSQVEAKIARCILSIMEATSKRAQSSQTVSKKQLQAAAAAIPKNTSALAGGNHSYLSGAAAIGGTGLQKATDKWTQAFQVRDALFANTVVPMTEDEYNTFQAVTKLEDKIALLEDQIAETDAGGGKDAAQQRELLVVAETFSKRKEHVVFNAEGRASTCFLTTLPFEGTQRTQMWSSLVQAQFQGGGSGTIGMANHVQLGATNAVHAENGFYYIGATNINAGPQGILPGMTVQDDKVKNEESAAYRSMFWQELRRLLSVDAIPHWSNTADIEDELQKISGEELWGFVAQMNIDAGDRTCEAAIAGVWQLVLINDQGGTSAYQSRTVFDENRLSAMANERGGSAALVETCGVLRQSLSDAKFRVIVMQQYVDTELGPTHTYGKMVTVRTGPWSELVHHTAKNKINVRWLHAHMNRRVPHARMHLQVTLRGGRTPKR